MSLCITQPSLNRSRLRKVFPRYSTKKDEITVIGDCPQGHICFTLVRHNDVWQLKDAPCHNVDIRNSSFDSIECDGQPIIAICRIKAPCKKCSGLGQRADIEGEEANYCKRCWNTILDSRCVYCEERPKANNDDLCVECRENKPKRDAWLRDIVTRRPC